MTPQSIAAFIARHGRTITLKRLAADGELVEFEIDAMACQLTGQAAVQLVGVLGQDEVAFVVEARSLALAIWPTPPRKGDQIVDRGKTRTLSRNAEARSLGADVAFYVIKASD
jgi:hypothetical protein